MVEDDSANSEEQLMDEILREHEQQLRLMCTKTTVDQICSMLESISGQDLDDLIAEYSRIMAELGDSGGKLRCFVKQAESIKRLRDSFRASAMDGLNISGGRILVELNDQVYRLVMEITDPLSGVSVCVSLNEELCGVTQRELEEAVDISASALGVSDKTGLHPPTETIALKVRATPEVVEQSLVAYLSSKGLVLEP